MRYFPKTFRIGRVDEDGKFRFGKGLITEPCLFGLDNYEECLGPLYLVEGEEDVLALQALGKNACTAGGSSEWNTKYAKLLEGKPVVIVPDNDEAGEKWLVKVKRTLPAAAVRKVPEEYEDVRQYLQNGGSLDSLEAGERSSSDLTIIDISEMEEPPPQEYLWGNWLPKNSMSIVHSDGGVGKSMFALALASCVCKGIPFLGMQTEKNKVLYIDWELNPKDHTRRGYQIARGMGESTPPKDLLYTQVFSPLKNIVDLLREQIQANNIGLVIIDSVGPCCGGDMNTADQALTFSSAIRTLNTTVLAIDHERQRRGRENKSSIDRPYGNVYKYNMARSVFKIKVSGVTENGTEYKLDASKNNFGMLPNPKRFRTKFSNDRIVYESR